MYSRPVCEFCYSHKHNQPNIKSTIKTAAKFAEEINQSTDNSETERKAVHKEKKIRRFCTEKMGKQQIQHGQYIRSVDRQFVGGEDTLLWLLGGDLKGSEIMAALDQELQTKRHATKMLQTEMERKCRLQTV